MKCKSGFLSYRVGAVVLMCMFWLGRPLPGAAQTPDGNQGSRAVGAGSTIVHSKFGGQIFGFDIDQTGSEGVLSEAKNIAGGKVMAAVETFDQASGKILKVVSKTETKDDFLTMGIANGGVGLVEREHVQGLFVTQRVYQQLNPVSSNKITGRWTPPLTSSDLILGVSRNQGSATTAVLAFENGGSNSTFVFGSNVAANTFQPAVVLTDPVFGFGNLTQVAYDSTTNLAVLAAADGAVGGPPPVFALVDLTTGVVNEFTGLAGLPPFRQGSINGLAVDSEDGIACTTTEVDFRVEFYDLKSQAAFLSEPLPGATSQLQSGTDVEFDPVNKLFFVAQSVSSTGAGSSIQVYDTKGKLVESLNGFNFSNASVVVFTHIALNPSTRSGYVDGPDSGVTQIQSFTY